MGATSIQAASDRRFAPLGRRAFVFLLVLAVHVLLGIMLFVLAPPRPQRPETPPDMQAFEVRAIPAPKAARAPAPQAKRAEKAKQATPKAAPPTPAKPLEFGIQLDQPLDIAALPNQRNAREAAESSASASNVSGGAYGPGEGPGGATLYPAEWYVEPSHAELAGYLPPGGAPPNSWGMIACRTIEKFHVEDCQEMAESPPGSGLARALRQAGWQFRVRPPKIDGKPMIGTWVRIRIDFTETGTR